MAARLRATLPARWFPDVGSAPVLETLLGALGTAWASVFDQIVFAQQQTRLRTLSGGFLDMAASDFRGAALLRRAGEPDDAFRSRLLPIFRDKATRAALIARLTAICGAVPWVFEPSRPADTGAYGAGPGVLLGRMYAGSTAGVFSSDVSPPVIGAPVYLHQAAPPGDSNVGYFYFGGLVAGATLTAQVSVWLPAGYSGTAPQLSLEGGAARPVTVQADPTLTNQWQTLMATSVASGAGGEPLVLRAMGGSGSNSFYSSGWGAVSSAAVIEGTASGYGEAGGWGSLMLPGQLFVQAPRPIGQGIPNVSGYGSIDPAAGGGTTGGYGGGAIEWAAVTAEAPHITDADLYEAIVQVLPAASIAWVSLDGAPTGGVADISNFYLGVNSLAAA